MTSFRPGHSPPQVTMPARVCFGSKIKLGARPGQFEEKVLRRRRGLRVSKDLLWKAQAVADGASDRRRESRLAENGNLDGWFHHCSCFIEPAAASRIRRRYPLGIPHAPAGTCFTCHTRSQYSRMLRSDENLPMRAALRIDIRVHACGSRHKALTRSWQST